MRAIVLAIVLTSALPVRAMNPRIVVLARVGRICPVETACTKFDDTEFACACRLEQGTWRAEAKVTSRPVVYLSHDRFLLHEFSHVYDFDHAITEHVQSINSMTFDSGDECAVFAEKAARTFPTFMRGVQHESVRRRDSR